MSLRPRLPSLAPCQTFPPPPKLRPPQSRSSSLYNYTQVKALIFSQQGNPVDVLSLHQHSISPSLPRGALLLRNLAAPINPADVNSIQGTYGTAPPFSALLGTAAPSAVPGHEAVFEVVSVAEGGTGHVSIKAGDWVIPAAAGAFGTWRTHAVASATDVMRIDRTALTPAQAATVSVNPCTAYRILRAFGPGTSSDAPGAMMPYQPGSAEWFIQNGANSGVGRAAIQFGSHWGLRSINVIREREGDPAATNALRAELQALGADHVVTEAELLDRSSWRDRLMSMTRTGRERVGLGLNCVGGRSAAALARSLSDGGTMVTYGAMGRQPIGPLPASALIFRDIRLLGFWLSRWAGRDPEGRRHAISDILDMTRNRKFQSAPVTEVAWNSDTTAEELKAAVGEALGGFRHKGLFVFGN